MYHLRNLINRTTMPADPEKNMNASEDFLLLVVHTHVVATPKAIQSFNPTEFVTDVAKMIVVNYIWLPMIDNQVLKCVMMGSGHLYVIELLSLGLLQHAVYDAIWEGEGERIMLYWKFLHVFFKSTNHCNYTKEAVNLLFQCYCKFSEREKPSFCGPILPTWKQSRNQHTL